MKNVFVFALLGLLNVVALAQTPPTTPAARLTVTGAVARPLVWSAGEVAEQPHVTVKAKDKQGKEHTYSGVPLSALLEASGAVADNKLHGKEFLKALKITAADNYQVFFALAELDPNLATRTIILADRCDGKPLAAGAGPGQVIVPGEKKPGRWIRQVTGMQVVTLP